MISIADLDHIPLDVNPEKMVFLKFVFKCPSWMDKEKWDGSYGRVKSIIWDGPDRGIAHIPRELMEDNPGLLEKIDHPVQVVHEVCGEKWIVRTDTGNPLHSYYCLYRHWVKQNWLVFKSRIIRTLAVWNLAYTHPGAIPRWRDVGRKNKN